MPAPGESRRAPSGRRLRCRRSHLHLRPRDEARPGAFSSSTSSAKPRAMNRTGLFIALGLALAVGLLFGIYPELDLKIAALFYDTATKSFPLKLNGLAGFARDGAMWIAGAIAAPAIIALVVKMVRPDRPLLISRRAIVFLLVTLTLAAGILTNLTFKSYWGRPRPVVVTQFNGPDQFVPWWDPRGACARNCSFFSGEGATAFWTYAPAALAPPAWRPLAYVAATLFGVITSLLRMAFGGHFFTDVAIAGLVTFLVIWLVHGYIYRWASTRLSDESVDAALTRLAWPSYRRLQRWRGREVGPSPPGGGLAQQAVLPIVPADFAGFQIQQGFHEQGREEGCARLFGRTGHLGHLEVAADHLHLRGRDLHRRSRPGRGARTRAPEGAVARHQAGEHLHRGFARGVRPRLCIPDVPRQRVV